MSAEKYLIANPSIVLREEFDDWAILFDPDTGNAYGLNPMGVLIWKYLDGHHSMENIISTIGEMAAEVPEDVQDHVRDFMKTSVDLGLAAYTIQG
jgi:SynChlorMet cassette protein ScmD